MLTIAGLLFTAMLPTYNFNISKTFPNPPTFLPRPADQTICFFRPGHMSPGHRGGERTVASMVLLVVGFFFRSIRLFESASTGVLARLGQSMGGSVVQKLEAIYAWCDLQHAPYGLSRTLLYWPLLATRWSIKVGWDFATSMYFEVCVRRRSQSIDYLGFISRVQLWLGNRTTLERSWGCGWRQFGLDLWSNRSNHRSSGASCCDCRILLSGLVSKVISYIFTDSDKTTMTTTRRQTLSTT